MLNFDSWSLSMSIIAFLVSGSIIGVAGVLLTIRAERIARITGLGELLTGAILIAAINSLAGLITTVTAAYNGHASLAISNSLGGIAAQTVFLVLADMVYRKANLEHAAASESNLLQGVVLIVLMALLVLAMAKPEIEVFKMHPVSFLIVAAYVAGLYLIHQAREQPMWRPRMTKETILDTEGTAQVSRQGILFLCLSFGTLALLVGVAGWVLAHAAISITLHAGLSETVVGGIFTAITNSLPELVVAITAVRRGALALAVGDILGGNAFDILFVSAADAAYRNGSIYAVITMTEIFWVALTILLVGILLLGLLRREKHGIANIGFESFLVLVFYITGIFVLLEN